jgi:hypothetical protein
MGLDPPVPACLHSECDALSALAPLRTCRPQTSVMKMYEGLTAGVVFLIPSPSLFRTLSAQLNETRMAFCCRCGRGTPANRGKTTRAACAQAAAARGWCWLGPAAADPDALCCVCGGRVSPQRPHPRPPRHLGGVHGLVPRELCARARVLQLLQGAQAHHSRWAGPRRATR